MSGLVSTALFPRTVYATLLRDRSEWLHAWVLTLPFEPTLVSVPRLVTLLCGGSSQDGVRKGEDDTMVSHDLLLLYRCALWYLPQAIEDRVQDKDAIQHFLEQVQVCLQHQHASLDLDNKRDVSVVELLHMYEDAILKYIFVSQNLTLIEKELCCSKTVDKLIPAILTLNSVTREELRLEQYRSTTLIPTSSSSNQDLERWCLIKSQCVDT